MKQRNTPQRRLVLQALAELEGHPSAEEVYLRAAQLCPGIGRATVYRCLKLLAHEGRLRRVELPDAADRYDRQTRPHYHLRCEGCGALIDLPVPYLAGLDANIGRHTQFEVHRHILIFEGICPDCRRCAGEKRP